MCGISGFNWQDKEKIGEMVSCLSHRGPDANGTFSENGVSLGHNRLAVIDLSPEANQPMFDAKKELVIVFNGEIYNFQKIKNELKEEYHFQTQSDSEVILAGYKKWGKEVVDKLNGMFALAIWDRKNGELFLARDHGGIKPLYYYWKDNKFIFASEIKAILTHSVPRTVDKSSLNYYFRMLYVPDDKTLIENIYKLPPAHMLILKNNQISVESYEKRSSTTDLKYSEAKVKLKENVINSVNDHLVSDVPVGVYLSGGIDSSTVLYAMSQKHSNIKTFSIGFDLESKEEESKFNHDFNLAQETAKFFGTKHFPVKISSHDALNIFETASYHNDDPISNPTFLAMYELARHARKEVTVALTGSGGDELFGGYDRYRIALAAYRYHKLPNFLRKMLSNNRKISKLEYRKEVDLYSKFMFEKDDRLKMVISRNFLEPDTTIKDYFDRNYFAHIETGLPQCLLEVDQESWLPDHFFLLSDKMSMASALEERVPLFSRDLKHFANSLPISYKLDLREGKKILKDAFKNDLPEYLFNQPKRGWFSPAAKWFREENFTKFARDVLSRDYYLGTKDLFDWVGISSMLDKHINKEGYNLTLLWAILTFQVWAKQYQIKIDE